jgi:hypothetical protein
MSERVEFRVPADVLARWRRLARKAGLSLSEWIRRACR